MKGKLSLVYVHIGNVLPKCLMDSLYQTLLVNQYSAKIFVILSDVLVNEFNERLSLFNLEYYTSEDFYYNVVTVVPITLLDMILTNDVNFNSYKDVVSSKFGSLSGFRDGFWVSTTARFYYIRGLMEMFSLENVFHIENDIMLYETFDSIYEYICKKNSVDKIKNICMVEDAPGRVIPSILFFPTVTTLNNLTQFITNELSYTDKFLNDMDILGKYTDRLCLSILPDENERENMRLVFDGAALGQYLGGVDYRNLPNGKEELVQYDNPSRGFINETAIVNASDYEFGKSKVLSDGLRVPITIPVLCKNRSLSKIVNLHIHSKQLYQFSSVFNFKYSDIISGDRVLSLCDFVITTRQIYDFHKNIEKYAKDVIIVKDTRQVNMALMNNYFVDFCKKTKKTIVKLFIYTHMLDDFMMYIFPHLDTSIEYVLYFHNSDHAVTDNHKDVLLSKHVKKVFAQNIDTTINTEKISLLPIGIANSMWKHGDILELYKVMSETYTNKKSGCIYVNINPNTYSYRQNVLDKIKQYGNMTLSSGKPYNEYLRELSSYRFCLCLRGNGIDTHRFWESLYLGVIPVVLNNKTTKCKNFIRYLRKLDLPFYEICEDDLDVVFTKYTDEFFSENLYKSMIKSFGSIYNLDSLKVDYYVYNDEV
jgi:hypothetical protein